MAIKRGGTCALLLAAALLGVACPAFPCGYYFPEAVFTYSRHPDLPLENFLQGQLGIILPTYTHSYLYVAYRYMAGKEFGPQQQGVLKGFWVRRASAAARTPNWIKQWVEARKKIPGLDPKPLTPLNVHNPMGVHRSEKVGTTYIGYYNCLPDAFRTAVLTLNQRTGQFGAASAQVKSWAQAQDQVFANCSGGGNGLKRGSNFSQPMLLPRTLRWFEPTGPTRSGRPIFMPAISIQPGSYSRRSPARPPRPGAGSLRCW